jgi:uncharacterized RDD family membrane protein YckC
VTALKETRHSTARYSAHETERMRKLDGLPLASFAARAAAFAIDFLLAAGVFVLLAVPVGKVLEKTLHRDIHIELNLFHNWYSIVYLVLFFGASLYVGNGRTVGKRVMGIRVLSVVHDHISLWHSIERALGYGASTLEAGFGFLQYFIHPNRRTVHDRIAETIVVKERI